jgi:hypothetical protein
MKLVKMHVPSRERHMYAERINFHFGRRSLPTLDSA